MRDPATTEGGGRPGDRQAEIRAAGGLVVRRGPDGVAQVAVVHRPKYDDWSFPKGKLEPGETDEGCAVREVREETGLTSRLGRPLGSTAYRDRFGRPKVVRYWLMHPVSGEFRPTREVDEVRWLPAEEARSLLTYQHDRELLDRMKAALIR